MLMLKFQSFAKQDLPKEHRILEPGAVATTDVKQNRLVEQRCVYGRG